MYRKLFSQVNIYILMWLVVMLNESMSLVPDSVSVMILFVLFAWSLILTKQVAREYSNIPFIRGLNILFLMFSIYGLLRVVGGEQLTIWIGSGKEISSRAYLIAHWSSLLPIYGFIYYSAKGQLTQKSIMIWTIVLILATTINYRYEETRMLERLVAGTLQDGVTNNQGYKFLALLPLLVFYKDKPLLQYAGIAYVLVFVFMGMKRGAILVGAICLLIFIRHSIKDSSSTKKTIIILLSVALFVAGFYLVSWYMENNAYFMSRIDDTISGNSSGRDTIYKGLLDYFTTKTNAFQIIFGLGADGTFKAIGQAAHNDWIEILIDCGVIGFFLYVSYWWKSVTTLRMSKKVNESLYLCLLLFFVTQFLKTFFSMSINDIPLSSTMAIGYCLYRFNDYNYLKNVQD